eukprot:30087-Pelagococcus_subviridis.AAC.29
MGNKSRCVVSFPNIFAISCNEHANERRTRHCTLCARTLYAGLISCHRACPIPVVTSRALRHAHKVIDERRRRVLAAELGDERAKLLQRGGPHLKAHVHLDSSTRFSAHDLRTDQIASFASFLNDGSNASSAIASSITSATFTIALAAASRACSASSDAIVRRIGASVCSETPPPTTRASPPQIFAADTRISSSCPLAKFASSVNRSSTSSSRSKTVATVDTATSAASTTPSASSSTRRNATYSSPVATSVSCSRRAVFSASMKTPSCSATICLTSLSSSCASVSTRSNGNASFPVLSARPLHRDRARAAVLLAELELGQPDRVVVVRGRVDLDVFLRHELLEVLRIDPGGRSPILAAELAVVAHRRGLVVRGSRAHRTPVTRARATPRASQTRPSYPRSYRARVISRVRHRGFSSLRPRASDSTNDDDAVLCSIIDGSIGEGLASPIDLTHRLTAGPRSSRFGKHRIFFADRYRGEGAIPARHPLTSCGVPATLTTATPPLSTSETRCKGTRQRGAILDRRPRHSRFRAWGRGVVNRKYAEDVPRTAHKVSRARYADVGSCSVLAIAPRRLRRERFDRDGRDSAPIRFPPVTRLRLKFGAPRPPRPDALPLVRPPRFAGVLR